MQQIKSFEELVALVEIGMVLHFRRNGTWGLQTKVRRETPVPYFDYKTGGTELGIQADGEVQNGVHFVCPILQSTFQEPELEIWIVDDSQGKQFSYDNLYDNDGRIRL